MSTGLVWLVLLGGATGCAFGDGLPIGELQAAVETGFAPSDGRLDDQGRLITAGDYAIRIDGFRASYDAVLARVASSESAGASAFDPANPPPEYSLCHNGHCHHEDGRLVDYEDIAAELAGAEASAGGSVVSFFSSEPVSLSAVDASVPLSGCENTACAVDGGRLATVELVLARLELSGTVFDRRTGEFARLPEGGLAIDLDIPIAATFSAAVDASFDEDSPVGARIDIRHGVSEKLFDPLDFSTDIVAGQLSDAAVAELREQALTEDDVQINLTRYDRD